MPKILFVDDEKLITNALEDYLDGSKYQILSANNGMDGLHTFIEKKPDLVITDLIMPDMEGLEFIRKLLGINKKLPIIVVSGNTLGVAYLETACVLGAKAKFTKPFDLEKLMRTVDELLSTNNTNE